MSKHNFEVESGKSIKLLTKNKVCTEDIVVSAYGGNKIPDGYIKPEGSMDIDENGTFDVREKAEVNVQVVAKPEKPYIDSSKLKCGNSMFSKDYGADLSLLDNLDTSGLVSTDRFCYYRDDLIEVSPLNIPNSTNGNNMFSYCTNLTGKVILNSPKVTQFLYTFSNCIKVTEIDINTDSCTNLSSCFQGCSSLEQVTITDTSKNTNWGIVFNGCRKLHTINGDFTIQNTNNCGVLFNGCSSLANIRFNYIGVTSNNLSFASCSKLTVESLLSILNALSDNAELDETYTIYLGTANLAKLTGEQLEIAYNKNILLQ